MNTVISLYYRLKVDKWWKNVFVAVWKERERWGEFKAAAFHVFGLFVRLRRKISTFLSCSCKMYLHWDLLLAQPVSLSAGSGNFHTDTKRACMDQSLFVWRPFIQSVNTGLYIIANRQRRNSFSHSILYLFNVKCVILLWMNSCQK